MQCLHNTVYVIAYFYSISAYKSCITSLILIYCIKMTITYNFCKNEASVLDPANFVLAFNMTFPYHSSDGMHVQLHVSDSRGSDQLQNQNNLLFTLQIHGY